jgi:hypothetical protein
MVYNSSEYSSDFVISKIENEPLETMFFKIDDGNSPASLFLEEQAAYTKAKQSESYGRNMCVYVMEKNNKNICAYVIPTKYNDAHNNDDAIIDCKNLAVSLLYKKWCLINKKSVQNPYKSKVFMHYIEDIGLMNSDYAVIVIEKEKGNLSCEHH